MVGGDHTMKTLHEGDIGIPTHNAWLCQSDGKWGRIEVYRNTIDCEVVVSNGDGEYLFFSLESLIGETDSG